MNPYFIPFSLLCFSRKQEGLFMSSSVLDRDRIIPRSAIRYRPVSKQPTATERDTKPEALSKKSQPPILTESVSLQTTQRPWLAISLAMLATILLILAVQSVWSWAKITADDLHYGRPRTFQVDAFVGHEVGKTPSHFIALNLHGQAHILELPGGDASKTRIFLGPQLAGTQTDLVPITLRFTAGAHPDMLVTFGEIQVHYANRNGSFLLQEPIAQAPSP
jgi:hypothetical protein